MTATATNGKAVRRPNTSPRRGEGADAWIERLFAAEPNGRPLLHILHTTRRLQRAMALALEGECSPALRQSLEGMTFMLALMESELHSDVMPNGVDIMYVHQVRGLPRSGPR